MKIWIPLIITIIFLCGLSIGLFLYPHVFHTNNNTPQVIRGTTYKYINPLLECELFSTSGTKELSKLQNQLKDFINQQKSEKHAEMVSVYFRDLNNGPWFGIEETENFSPASLLKLPLMISFLKVAETDSQLLAKKVSYTEEITTTNQDYYPPEKTLEVGQEYSVEDLLTRMIQHSDNKATHLLLQNISGNPTNELDKELGLSVKIDEYGDRPISVKEYASLYRVLFNASYLSRQMSEKALEMLSNTNYKTGIVAGVQEGVTVAHKFGERALPNGTQQLHDCGIIYYPHHPYLLCIMTRGNTYNNLESVIQNISQQVYTEMEEIYKK